VRESASYLRCDNYLLLLLLFIIIIIIIIYYYYLLLLLFIIIIDSHYYISLASSIVIVTARPAGFRGWMKRRTLASLRFLPQLGHVLVLLGSGNSARDSAAASTGSVPAGVRRHYPRAHLRLCKRYSLCRRVNGERGKLPAQHVPSPRRTVSSHGSCAAASAAGRANRVVRHSTADRQRRSGEQAVVAVSSAASAGCLSILSTSLV
jgi:hypothetical protein